jgi:hypothetical protein
VDGIILHVMQSLSIFIAVVNACFAGFNTGAASYGKSCNSCK